MCACVQDIYSNQILHDEMKRPLLEQRKDGRDNPRANANEVRGQEWMYRFGWMWHEVVDDLTSLCPSSDPLPSLSNAGVITLVKKGSGLRLGLEPGTNPECFRDCSTATGFVMMPVSVVGSFCAASLVPRHVPGQTSQFHSGELLQTLFAS